MLTLYLARHGETEENVAQILQGHLPGCLTQKGREQADGLCFQLQKSVQEKIDVLLSSDLQRCLDTAEPVSRYLGMPIAKCRLLRERDWGSLTGAHIPELKGREFPADVESVEQMFSRAAQFLEYVSREYDGKCVLAIGHGLFDRVIQACFDGCTIADIPRMGNAEIRKLVIPSDYKNCLSGIKNDVEKADN